MLLSVYIFLLPSELAEQVRKRQGTLPADHGTHSEPPRSMRDHSSPPPDDEEDDNLSMASSKLVGFIPTDQGRWKFSKSTEQARGNFIQQLKDYDISHREEHWSRFDSTFHILVESLELQSYVFDPLIAPPLSHSDMMGLHAGNDDIYYAQNIIPGMYHDLLCRIHHRDPKFKGIEIMQEEEKRRFDSAMVLLFSILTSCTASPRLDGVMDREIAHETKNVPMIYKFLKEHFV